MPRVVPELRLRTDGGAARGRDLTADIDDGLKSVAAKTTGATEPSIDRPSKEPFSPFAAGSLSSAFDLPESVEQLRDTLRPMGPWDVASPEGRVQAAQEQASSLFEDLTAAAKEAPRELRAELRAEAERTKILSDVLAAFVAGATEPDPQRAVGAGSAGTFPLVAEPGGKVTAQVSPKPFPATLQVASPSHGEVHVTGLARLFPAHTVHAKDCTTVVDGNDCTLTAKDHYHVRSVSVSFGKLAETGSPENAALQRLIENPTDKGSAQFQKAMSQCIDAPEHGDTQTSLPVRSTHVTLASGAKVVHQGDGSHINVTTHYVVEQSELSIAELCATDRAVVHALVNVIRAPEPGAARDKFARAALASAGHVDELALLDHSTQLHGASTSIRGLFGVDAVKHAPAVLVGTDNMLKTDMRLSRGRSTLDGGLAGLDHIRNLAAEVHRPRRLWLGHRLPPNQNQPSPTCPGCWSLVSPGLGVDPVASRVPWWAVLSAGAAVFVGCGIFFAFQGLGAANDYATIASFFLALVTAIGSWFSLARSRQKQEKEAAAQSERPRRTGSRSLLLAWKTNGIVNHGNNARFEQIHIGAPSPQEEKKQESGLRPHV
jgi:hypothetical protein